MTSYELLDFYEEILSEMQNLSTYTDELSKMVDDITVRQDSLLNLIYPDTFDMGNGTILANLNSRKSEVINKIQQFAMTFNFLENHEKLIKSKHSIKTIFEKYQFGLEEEKNKITNFFSEYENVSTTIYQYVRTRNKSLIVELLNKVSSIVNEYYKFISSYESVRYFVSKTENKVEVNENEKSLKLHFYDEQLDPKYFALNIDSINKSYEIMCQILKISSSEYPLKVVKIESGSLLAMFLGSEDVVDALAFMIKKTTELLFNKYTFEGKVLRQKQLFDLLKEELEVIAKYKELGIDISNDEDIIKYNYQLVKSIGNLVGQTTKVKINDEELSLEGNLKQRYLEESKTLLLEEIKDKNDLEQIDKED